MLIISPETVKWKIFIIAGFLLVITLVFIFLRLSQKRVREFKRLKVVVPMEE